MAFPVVEGNATDGGKSTSLTLDLPASIVTGEMLLAVIGSRGDCQGVSFPAGWTEVHDATPANLPGLVLGYREADGTEGSSITLTMGSDRDCASTIMRISGWDGTTAPELNTATGDNSNPNPPSLTPSWGSDDNLWIAFGNANDGEDFSANPSGYTFIADRSQGQASMRTAYLEAAASSEDPGTFTINNGRDWYCATIAVRGASAGGGVTGTLSAQEAGSDTFSGSGSVTVTGDLSEQEAGADSASASGSVAASGDLAAQEAGADTFSATGTVEAEGVTGTLAAQEAGADTLSASGNVTVGAALDVQEAGADAASATGTVTVTGSASGQEAGQDSAAASGSVGVTGDLVAQEAGQDDLSAAGSVEVSGALAAQEAGSDTFTGSGITSATIVGEMAVQEAGEDTFSAEGTVTDADERQPGGFLPTIYLDRDGKAVDWKKSAERAVEAATREAPKARRQKVRRTSKKAAESVQRALAQRDMQAVTNAQLERFEKDLARINRDLAEAMRREVERIEEDEAVSLLLMVA